MILNKIIDQQKTAIKSMAEDDELEEKEMEITEESIMKELGSSEEECNQYISARDALAYVSTYRLPTKSLSSRVAAKMAEQEESRNSGSSGDDREVTEGLIDKRSSVNSTPDGE